jgi:predicted Zn-dependent protease
LVARVKRDLGDREAAIRQYNWLKQLQPENMIARYELARVLVDMGDYPAAFTEVSWLLKHDREHSERYRTLYEALERRLKKD